MDEIGSEFVKIDPDSALCFACLSNDRSLSALKHHNDLFHQLLGQTDWIESECILLCWECKAMVRKIYSFVQQVKNAQFLLQQSLYQLSKPPCLSTLCRQQLYNLNNTVEEGNVDNRVQVDLHEPFYNAPTIPHTNVNASTQDTTESNIKVCKEEDTEFDIDNFDDGMNYETNQENYENGIKQEIKSEAKSEKENKKRENFKFQLCAKIRKNPDVDAEKYFLSYYSSRLTDAEIEKFGMYKGDVLRKKKRWPVCEACKKWFYTQPDYRKHQTFCHILKEEHHGPFTCLICSEVCQDQESLRTHWSAHIVTMRCKICNKAVNSPCEMRAHLETHVWLYTCKKCDLPGLNITFTSSKDFSYHHKELHKRVLCDYCGKEQKSKRAMMKHIRREHLPRVCSVCKKTFSSYRNLSSHYLKFHPALVDKDQTPEIRYCVECDKQFPSVISYKHHLTNTIAHNPIIVKRRYKMVPCPECGKVFSKNIYMKNHFKQIHKKMTDHYCALCDKYLVTAFGLRKHIQGVHMKIREPKNKMCDICGRGFTTNAVLKKHRRTHTGERPFKCTHCPAAFTQSTPLKSHLRTQHRVILPPKSDRYAPQRSLTSLP